MCCLVHPLIFLNPQTLQTCEIQASVVIQLLALELGGEKTVILQSNEDADEEAVVSKASETGEEEPLQKLL
ncbi:hypothetical protein AK812_SmicGene13082 [Symbiodinium microadriaticum]|uniref:Uncharacterized protein n=1 Tax=Symbiodinium microadriaticum TaxID=2951 RepID=A0A1Q9E915_SYMMI|nr:hypothetical protein AK812_SmicGene13082 [Symbiodinium microadriaticum]